eukprot:Protomagalhaensia_sp_Gyna_25__1193@NODE_1591_length_1706_cov_3_510498_g1297_i0_p2_GENE_NODE_1591_length_1706_cov_3_510498_g1297_i0NODE_1591_length_1706_cov_3_510498_g1297_i0_p2_ORF_typecomplete_len107_score4_99Rrp15p/PF07890_12/0_028_NODE_1591_length_1706_cov_3_510498_g1297_i0661981
MGMHYSFLYLGRPLNSQLPNLLRERISTKRKETQFQLRRQRKSWSRMFHSKPIIKIFVNCLKLSEQSNPSEYQRNKMALAGVSDLLNSLQRRMQQRPSKQPKIPIY